jgi:hypothetical protein
MRPERELRALLQHFRAARHPRPHGQREYLIQPFVATVVGSSGSRIVRKADRRNALSMHPAVVPPFGKFQQVEVPSDRLNALIVGIIERAVATQHVDDLPDEKAEIAWFDANVLEPQERFACRVVFANGRFVQLEPGQRDAALDPTMQLQQLDMHIHRI